MKCRAGCGACCIIPSITSFIPGMPSGKPAGQRCVQLDDNNRCQLFQRAERPDVCVHFQASADSCGRDYDEAVQLLSDLERLTR